MIDEKTIFTPDKKDVEIQCFKTTVKQLSTNDGLGKLKGFKIGDEVIIAIMSKRECELKTQGGIVHNKWIFDIIDINGKPLGWIYAECVFPNMVSDALGLLK